MSKITKQAVATRHVSRVTLNLIRLSKSCPAKLRPVLTRLAGEAGWDLAKLEQHDLELVYALVNDTVAERARHEFAADLETVIDHKYVGADIDCGLCGHEQIRFEFLLRNHGGGEDVWTGSRCIVEYGINVLGEETAEGALLALQKVVAEKKREYDRWEWQQEHTTHAIDFQKIVRGINRLAEPVTIQVWHHLGTNFQGRSDAWMKSAEGALRYYAKHGYLLKTRTDEMYGDKPLLKALNALVEERKAAESAARS